MTKETSPDPIVTVPIADLLRVAPFKGCDDTRYYLNGVLITPYEDHALLMATNGHWMAIYESKDARADKERILELPRWFLDQVTEAEQAEPDDDLSDDDAPSRFARPKTLTVADEASRIVVSDVFGEVLVKPGSPFIDGKFPDCLKVLPEPSTLEQGIFSPVSVRYFAGLRDAIPFDREYPLFCYHQRGASGKPIVFRFGNLPNLVVAVMPRRDDETVPAWPKWTQKLAKEEAA